MTGEMSKPQNAELGEKYWSGKRTNMGYSAIGDESILIRPNYPDYFELADKLKEAGFEAEVEPFDVYQGPYIRLSEGSLFGKDIWKDENGDWIERHRIGIGVVSGLPIFLGPDDIDVLQYAKEVKIDQERG